MTLLFFETPAAFRKWLTLNHETENELWVGFFKIASGKQSITWSQSVDEALCFGWIDGIRKSIDKDSYTIRFTPRKPNSNWSAINIKKVEELTTKGLMHPSGFVSFQNRKENKQEIYSYENKEISLSKDLEEIFKKNETAWMYFQSLAPSYRKTSIYWVMTAKQHATRIRRLNEIITDSISNKNRWKN